MRFKELPPTLKVSVWDAAFFFMMFGAGECYLSAYGVYLGLSPLQIGLLTSFPLFLGALSQLMGVRLMEAQFSRRGLLVSFGLLQALSWLLIISVPWLGLPTSALGWALILTATLYCVSGHIIVPSWTSLMGDLVPDDSRGSFFGLRSKICGYFLLTSFLGAGYLIKLGEQHGFQLLAFNAVFGFAFLSRCISGYFLTRHDNPEYLFTHDDAFTFKDFLRRAPRSNFARFTIFHGLFNCCMFIAGPFFVLYMLRELSFSYWQYSLLVACWMASNFFMMQLWGKFGDVFGNKRVIAFSSCGLCCVPFAWSFSASFYYLLGLQVVAGIFTAGLQLGSLNFMFDAVTPGKRGRCTAYLWVINATCIITGSLIGSYLVHQFSAGNLQSIQLFDSPYLSVFAVAGCARLLVVLTLLESFKEVRSVPKIEASRVYRFSRIQPFAGAGIGMAVGLYQNRLKPIPSRYSKKFRSRMKKAS